MKKTFLNKLLAPIGKGIIIFAVFGLSIYAYAAVDFPTSDPEPVTGVVGQFVGLSSASFDGSIGGYGDANELCPAGSHICIAEEITRSYVNGNLALADAVDNPGSTRSEYFVWINSGAPGYEANVNDCKGWISNSPNSYGSIWNIKGNFFAINACDNSYRAACCM